MSKRGHDSRAVRLRDKEMLQNDTIVFVSPFVNHKNTIVINNCIFEMRKDESEQEARLRINGTYKYTIL